MFWPPTWTGNTRVTLSDSLQVYETGELPRHEPYAMEAAVMHPWLEWDGIDVRWPASDPMIRILLIGVPSAQLRTVNQDTYGTLIQLGDPPQGFQAFEIVSKFDWYEDGQQTPAGFYVWARLCLSGAGEWGAVDDTLLIEGGLTCELGSQITLGVTYTVNILDTDSEETWFRLLVPLVYPTAYTVTLSGHWSEENNYEMLGMNGCVNIIFGAYQLGVHPASVPFGFQLDEFLINRLGPPSNVSLSFRIDLA